MFDFIRSHQRLMQFLLLVLIVPSFALIGVSGYSSYVSGDHDLVKVGKSAVTMQEFERARANQLRQMQQSSPGGFDPAVLDNPVVRGALLESLIDYRVLATTAAAERFSVSDTVLRQSIASMPQLQENGQFSAELYNQTLAAVGMSTRDFEQSQRFELALGRVLGPVGLTARIPAPVVSHLENALTDARTVRLQLYEAENHLDSVSVSDSDIQAWYEEHKQDFEIPQQVSVQYLLLDEAAAMANLPELTDSDLQSYYDQNKARFTRKARINLSHIQIDMPADADQREQVLQQASKLAAQAASSPESFAELAREHSQDAGSARSGGELGWVTQGTWPPALDQAIFALEQGQVSDVVEGVGSYHIFLVHDLQPEQVQSLDEVRETIAGEIRHQMGAERFADMATRLTGLVYDQPESLEPAAMALGVELKSAQGITRDGLLPVADAGPDAAAASDDAWILDDVRVRRAVFSPQVLNERHNSGIIEISPDTMLTVRVQEVTPAHIPEVAQVSDRIQSRLTSQRAHEYAVKAGQDALAALTSGNAGQSEQAEQSVEAESAEATGLTETTELAEATGLAGQPQQFGEPMTISRINPQGLEKQVLDAALAVDPETLPAYAGVETARGFALIRVEGVASEPTDSLMLATLPGQLTQLWGQAEESAVLQAMRVQSEVELLPEAHDAINQSDAAD